MADDRARRPYRMMGRYAIFGPIASGGMATVHYGRLLGTDGFSRVVAVKRLHAQYAAAPEFAASFLDEARLCARVRHPNVVPVLDVLREDAELALVMEYVSGEALSSLLARARERELAVPVSVATGILCGALHGLHAAHDARDEGGRPLGIVHRDVSPHNLLVGADGVPRVVDFGIARAAGRLQTTEAGQVKGKLAYMAPEQILCAEVSRRTDVYAAAVVLWETLAGRRLFHDEIIGNVMHRILDEPVPPPSAHAPPGASIPRSLDAAVLRALDRDARRRFATARDLALAIEEAAPCAPAWRIGEWVDALAGHVVRAREATIAQIEAIRPGDAAGTVSTAPPPPAGPDREATGRTETGIGPVAARPAPDAARPPRSRARVALVAGASALALAAAAAAVLARRAGAPPAVAGGSAPAASPSGFAAAAPSGAAPEAVMPDTAIAPRPDDRPAVPVAARADGGAPMRPVSRGAPPASAGTARGTKHPSCSPPYWVDAEGIRHLKPECM